MKIILTRHGETLENKAGIIQGHLPGKLSETGILQAQKLSERLKTEKIDAVYSSDLARAADTAKEILRYHAGKVVVYTKKLREIYLGSWQGKCKKDLGLSSKTMEMTTLPADAESNKELYHRANNFLKTITHKHLIANHTVLLIGHNNINKAIIAALYGKSAGEIKKIDNFFNTSVSIVEITKTKKIALLFNCKKHLM